MIHPHCEAADGVLPRLIRQESSAHIGMSAVVGGPHPHRWASYSAPFLRSIAPLRATHRGLRQVVRLTLLKYRNNRANVRSFYVQCNIFCAVNDFGPRPNERATSMRRANAQLQSDRRAEILDAAERCFARAGFHQASMQEICAEAGMSPGNLYRYFPSKEALIAGISERNRAEA